MRFCRPSTLTRSKTGRFIDKSEGFRKRSPKWKLLKTEVYRFAVDGKKRSFSKTLSSQLIMQSQLVSRVQLSHVHKTTKRSEKAWEGKRILRHPFSIP